MTLVLGRGVSGKQVYLLADTRITDPLKQANPTQGMLKIIILTPTLAVGFAGDPELAKKAVQEYRLKFGSASSFQAAIDHFKAHTLDNQNDYLLAFASSFHLIRITKGDSQPFIRQT